ncbi:MAG: DUF4198 domain-containing protein [Planctomycetaceae bacterium]|jgi:hypothetical protein|nr:DUF4198 domain-containing protein [Planctomycetaceae bacterium]
MMKYIMTIWSVVILLFSFSGCGGKKLPSDLPRLNPVSITIIQDGKPLAEASVTLTQLNGAAKWSAISNTNANGVANNFSTNGMYKGVAAGTFKVCIRKVEREREKFDIPPEPTEPAEKYAWRQKYIDRAPPPKEYDLIEKKYSDLKTTPLEIEVIAGKNEFSFDVGKSVRILYKR